MIMSIGKKASIELSDLIFAPRTINKNDNLFSATDTSIKGIDRISVGVLQLYACA
jgi:hypothetical protein